MLISVPASNLGDFTWVGSRASPTSTLLLYYIITIIAINTLSLRSISM